MIDRISELEATITDAFGMLAGLLRFPEDQAAGDAEIGDASDALAELVEIAGKQERLLTEWSWFYLPLPSSNDANLRNRTLAALSPSPEEPNDG